MSGELTADQVARFVAVEERVERRIGTRLAMFRAQFDALGRQPKGPTSRMLRRSLGDLSGPYLQGKEELVKALNDAGFSQTEYEWVRQQVYPAAGLTFAYLDIQELLDDAGDLERAHASECERWLPLAFFGL